MAKTWTSEASTPAAVITFAGAMSKYQPMILATQRFNPKYEDPKKDIGKNFGNKNFIPPVTVDEPQWLIKSLEVNLQRDWNTSEANIKLAFDLPEGGLVTHIPKLPNLSSYRGGNDPYLGREDEIRIYAGYIPGETYQIQASDLCDTPLDPQHLAVELDFTDPGDLTKFRDLFGYNAEACLVPIFWGFIDQVEIEGSDKGIQLILSCRDRMRVFNDTRILSLNSPGTTGSKIGASVVATTAQGEVESLTGDRVQLIKTIVNSVNRRDLTTTSSPEDDCWRPISEGFSFRGAIKKGAGQPLERATPFLFTEAINNNAIWIAASLLRLPDSKANPRINTWCERPELSHGTTSATLQVINKTPIELINHLALTEESPIDFYASHINGDYIFGPRVLDTSGFNDPERQYRTYYFLTYPQEVYPAPNKPPANAMIKSLKGITSTVATYNNFLVIDSGVGATESSLLKNVKITASLTSWELGNRYPTPPCRTQIIADGSLRSYPNMAEGGAITALSAARRWSRDGNGVQLELVGDPTLYPGEAIRVYNSIIHDYNSVVTTDPKQADQQIADQKKYAADQSKVLATDPKDTESALKANTNMNNLIGSVVQPGADSGRTVTDRDSLILPIYKVRTVYHKIIGAGTKGFITTIKCTADF